MTTTTKRAAAFLRWLQVRPAPAGQAGTDPAHVTVDPVAARIAEFERIAIEVASLALRKYPGQDGIDIALDILRRHLHDVAVARRAAT